MKKQKGGGNATKVATAAIENNHKFGKELRLKEE